MNAKTVCPLCEETSNLKRIEVKETLIVRNEEIEVNGVYIVCDNCEERYEPDGYDKLDIAYRKYREINNWLQPEEIKELRKKYRLKQKELAEILGFGEVTLSRYENGALQDKPYENLLQMVANPLSFISFIKENNTKLSYERKNEIINLIETEIRNSKKSYKLLKNLFNYGNGINNGNRTFDIENLKNLILILCKDGLYKTALNKLLFYCDFSSFKEYNKSITGIRYVHLPYGPVPDKFETIFGALIDDEILKVKEIKFPEGNIGEKYFSNEKVDLNLFKDEELKLVFHIKNKLSDLKANELSDISHKEEAYKKTNNNEFISYDFAKYLK
ncbi:MAG: DUF4065 domain-containing protein [Candidatus Muirbacterium halophilum]|nr:DUF4065 domain-containing protein [Candidatus Muirbacterium halophilum]MCK9476161.1 DUF4065 domain-containing protein [Candidatus Muirbacterium halophilum]